jgi:hypothetical protein
MTRDVLIEKESQRAINLKWENQKRKQLDNVYKRQEKHKRQTQQQTSTMVLVLN